jgi:hypothetical protein
MRKEGLDKDDPLYDEYSQRLDEYTFSIANSKQELRYAEGRVGDAAMATFYKGWAGKLPQDSEAWRNMMMLAAQYKDRAKSSGGGGGGRGGGGGGGYNSAANRIPSGREITYGTMVDALESVARAEGILNTEKEKLSDLRVAEGDASRLMHIMEVFNNDPKYAAYKRDVLAFINQYGNKNFKGFSWDNFNAEKKNYDNGIAGRLRTAQAAGHKTDVKAIIKEAGEADTAHNSATSAGSLAFYEDARKLYDLQTEDPNATSIDLYLATQKYRSDLESIQAGVINSFGVGASPSTDTIIGHLNNEIRNLYGENVNAPTLYDDSRGTVAAFKKEGGTGTEISEAYNAMVEEVRMLATGQGTIMRVDKNGQPTDDPTAPYGVVPNTAVGQGVAWVSATGHLPPSIEFEGQVIDISRTMTAVLPTPIYVVGTTGAPDRQGRPTDTATPKSNSNIANHFTMPDGTELVQYWDAGGTKRWTNDASALFEGPNGEQLSWENTPDGMQITMPVVGAAGVGKTEFDPNTAIAEMYDNPITAAAMPNKVGLSSYSVWLTAARTADSDPGVAFAMDPRVMREAISRELAGSKPGDLSAAWREAEVARTDYLKKTPAVDVRLREAAKNRVTPTMADEAGVGEADVIGLRREVTDFYKRLDMSGKEKDDSIYSSELTERDKVIKAALQEDSVEAYRIAGFDTGGRSRITPMEMKYGGAVSGQMRREVAVVGVGRGQPASTVSFNKGEKDDLITNLRTGVSGEMRKGVTAGLQSVAAGIAGAVGYRPNAPVPTFRGKEQDDRITPPTKKPTPPPAYKPPVMPTQKSNPGYYASEKGYAAPAKPKLRRSAAGPGNRAV